MNNVITDGIKKSFPSFCEAISQSNEEDKKHALLDLYIKESDPTTNTYIRDDAFIKKKIRPFPESIASIVHHPQAILFKCGFLSGVNELWIAANKSLYIWDFSERNNVFKYQSHDDIENIEVCIKEKYLYVCTKSDLSVHSIEKTDSGELKILSSAKLRTNGIVMSNIHSINKKQTYMKGNDGHIYSFQIACSSEGMATSIEHFVCLTEQPYMKYFSYFIQSAPEDPVRMMSVSSDNKTIYALLSDSTIQAISIENGDFAYINKYKADNIEYIQTISPSQSKIVDLIAVSDKGDRHYLSNTSSGITLIQKRLAPPVPGSVLFHKFTEKALKQCFYGSNIFASVCKSHDSYFVLTCPNTTKTSLAQSTLKEDFYIEKANNIYKIIEYDTKLTSTSLEDLLEPCGKPTRQILTLNQDGVAYFAEKRVTDRFASALATKNVHSILEFSEEYGTNETVVLCLSKGIESEQAISFLESCPSVHDGILLYVSRLCKQIWVQNVLEEVIPLDIYEFVEKQLDELFLSLERISTVDKNSDILIFIKRCKEGASFTRFLHKMYLQDKSAARASLAAHPSLSFEKLVSTEQGALFAKDTVIACIESSDVLSTDSIRSRITDFLSENCSLLLGEKNIVFYRGLECHQAARSVDEKQPHLDQSLEHFKQIINLVSVDQLKELSAKYCALKDYIGSVKLVLAKYHIISPEQESHIQDIIFETKQLVLNEYKDYFLPFIQESLNLLDQENYHYRIYKWLIDNRQTKILVSLSTPHIVRFFSTLPKDEGHNYLFQYYLHQKNYINAVETLKDLAVKIENITLDRRIEYLNLACKYTVELDNTHTETIQELKKLQRESIIQSKIRDALNNRNTDNDRKLAETLDSTLKTSEELYENFAVPNNLHEEALILMDLMELYDWKYSKSAWENIIKSCNQQEKLREKLVDLGKQLYPSFISYPLYILVHILDKHCKEHTENFEKDFVVETFCEVGVPREIIVEARSVSS